MDKGGSEMHYLSGFLCPDSVARLSSDVLASFRPGRNVVDLMYSPVVSELAARVSEQVGQPLRYFKAFVFLLSDTTAETATSNEAEGWHVDDSCTLVDGECFNVWIPLYCSSSDSGVRVIERARNQELYALLGDETLPLDIWVRSSAERTFSQLADIGGAEIIMIRRGSSCSAALRWEDIEITEALNPVLGDVAVFSQRELHQGHHRGGVRIQLSIKFMTADARIIYQVDDQLIPSKPLSKHGRLEAQLVSELLRVSMERMAR